MPENYPYYSYVGRIEKEIDRIARIVRQMFNLYRPDQETPNEFWLDETLSDVVALLESNARQRNVRVEVMANLRTCVSLPEGLLRQVLFNVIQNAVEASPDGEKVEIKAAIGEQKLQIAILDRGSGVAQDFKNRIFEPFFSTKTDFSSAGLGLGLSVAKGMVETMGGSLSFENGVTRGTQFRIQLPLNRCQKETRDVRTKTNSFSG